MSSPARTRRRRLLRQITACPDCSADVKILSDAPPAPHVRIAHDTTCPWYRQSNAGVAFTQFRIIGPNE